jgi:hypothetical protein
MADKPADLWGHGGGFLQVAESRVVSDNDRHDNKELKPIA